MLQTASRLVLLVAITWGCSANRASVPRVTINAKAPSARRAAPLVAPAHASAPRSELRVGTSGDYAPFSVRDAAGAVTGFDVELAGELAHDLGFQPTFVPFHWSELGERLVSGAFDVVMSGVTWQPTRAVSGYMTRAVARGGPCVLGDTAAPRIAVNRGGVLEGWARTRYPDRELISVEQNTSLPELLTQGRVGAIVTDSFERRAFERPGFAVHCEPALSRKVYWVGPARSHELGERIDAWLGANTARVQASQQRWFGERQRLDATTHLVDLIARRFAFMPLVAALKVAHALPIEDLPREREVLADVGHSAQRMGLPQRPAIELFALQIELSKAVQRRTSEASSLDLSTQIRPALSELGERILRAVVAARAEHKLAELSLVDLDLLSPWLVPEERQRLLESLRALADG